MIKIQDVAASELPKSIGEAFQGGFLGRRYKADGEEYAVIVSGKEGRLRGTWGEFSQDVTGARSCIDGAANTEAMAEAGSAIAKEVRALRSGGFDDWHIPARDQLEMIYRDFKPTTDENYCTYRDGDNPTTGEYPYTPDSPTQTTIAAFQEGGEHALEPGCYMSSTQYSPGYAYVQYFVDGTTSNLYKGYEVRALAVRTIHIVH
jgi:hypothetical protein